MGGGRRGSLSGRPPSDAAVADICQPHIETSITQQCAAMRSACYSPNVLCTIGTKFELVGDSCACGNLITSKAAALKNCDDAGTLTGSGARQQASRQFWVLVFTLGITSPNKHNT